MWACSACGRARVPTSASRAPGSTPAQLVHLYADGAAPVVRAGVIDHIAFTAQGLREVKGRFDERGLKYDLRQQKDAGTWQLFCFDPNGAKVELDFDRSETL